MNRCQVPMRRPSRRRFLSNASLFAAGSLLLPTQLRTQVPAVQQSGMQPALPVPAGGMNGVQPGTPMPIDGKSPYAYSGVSGPGWAVDAASGHGGYRSGSSGLAYQGEHPYPFPTQPWEGYSTGSAVTAGLIPSLLPLIDVQVRDTIVCRGGDGNYYLTGSTGENIWAYNRGVELWRSPDLKSWQYLGLVWDMDKEGTWERAWRPLHDKPCRAIWAPEIHYLRGNYYICLSIAPTGISILKSTSGKPTGPYVHAWSADRPIVNAIDPTLFEDTGGNVYFTYSSATHIVRLKDDLSGYAENPREVRLADPDHTPAHHAQRCVGRGSNDLGTEGAVLFKANGIYYIGAADSYEGRYSTCLAMSDSIYGPYHTRHESVPCGGGTGFFQDHAGGWWSSYFGNDTQSPFREKPAIVKVDFDAQGKVIVSAKQRFVSNWRPK
jgi:xylan 1,4-beta-xylosidase